MTEQTALEQYKTKESITTEKSKHLKTLYHTLTTNNKLKDNPLNLSQSEQEKLSSRFKESKLSHISIQAIIIGLEILNEHDFDAKQFNKAFKLAWIQLSNQLTSSDKPNENDQLLYKLEIKEHSIPSESISEYKQTIGSDVIWKRADCYQVLLYLYGAERIDYIERAWQDMVTHSFQTGWERRSFRTSPDNLNYFENRFGFLRESSKECRKGWRDEYYQLPKLEKVRWAWDFWHTNSPLEWSAELDMAGEAGVLEENELFNLMRDIIYNRDDNGDKPSGKVSRELIKALLASSQIEAWELVKDLLLTAQRQEGLRQTILESLDEGSRGAIPYFIDVILENNLTRFSSVVRAIDVWTGMCWEADKATACKKFLQSAKAYFDDPQLLDRKIDSKNNLDVLSALWVTSIDDVAKTIPMIEQLIESEKVEKVTLAMYFISQWDLPELELPLYLLVLESEKLSNNLLSLASVLTPLTNKMISSYGTNDTQAIARLQSYYENHSQIYTRLQSLLKQSDIKEKTFEGKVFAWLTVQYQREHIHQLMGVLAISDTEQFKSFINDYKNELSLNTRENLTRQMYSGRAYDFDKSWVTRNRNDKKSLTDIERYFAMTFIDDRGEQVGNVCAKMLIRGKLTEPDLPIIEALFCKKGKMLGKRLQYVMLGQASDIAISMTEKLIKSDNTQQRIAGLELALELHQDNNKDGISDTEKTKVSRWITNYEDNLPKAKNGKAKKLTKAETSLLERFGTVEKGVLSAENGWGLYTPNNISAINTPIFDKKGYFPNIAKLAENSSNKNKYEFGLSKPLDEMVADLEKLKQIYLDNAEFEYEMENWDGSMETTLLSHYFRSSNRKLTFDKDGQKYLNSYPLWQTWLNWYQSSQWTARDLFIFSLELEEPHYWNEEDKPTLSILDKFPEYLPTAHKKIPNIDDDGYHNPLEDVLYLLTEAHPFTEKNDYLLSACESLYANLPEEILKWQSNRNPRSYYYGGAGDGWQSLINSDLYLNKLASNCLTQEQSIQAWHLYRWRQMSGLDKNRSVLLPPFWLCCLAYKHKLINDDELMEALLSSNNNAIESLSQMDIEAKHEYQKEQQKVVQGWVNDAPVLLDMLVKVREYCLDIELKRGEVETPVSQFIARFRRFYGINRLVEAISVLGKKNLYASYIYGVENGSKTQMLSYIVGHCYPLSIDKQECFDKAVTEASLSDERLVQIGIYSPQWQSYVENHLKWDGLASGIWWMNAHTKTAEYESKSAQEESEIAKYSTIDLNEFKRGAVDIDWFNQAYDLLGKKRWSILYDCAKFVSDGNGHRRAKLYSDVLTGELKIREVTKKVKDKRDQDFVRLYGLVPLSKTNADKDVLTRYTYLQQFKKESRQFGSQRQASEGLSVQVAMDNLARTAGYPDPLRLGWAMESKTVQAILDSGTRVEVDETTIELVIDDNGKTDIIVTKAGKKQKSIPTKYRKNSDVEALKKHKKTLTEQFRRAKTSLEDSMVRGDVFTAQELDNLFKHPVISKLLAKLVFISKSTIGFFNEGNLTNHKADSTKIADDAELRIAHCIDLHKSGEWRDYQTYCFDKELKQPFKQIFRELYLPTPDELTEKTISRRYAGHQVQPAKTVALLKSRGWRVDYEEGLQKVYHNAGFRVKLYAMADWFSPADTESPTLETIEFHRLQKLENIDDKLSYNLPFDEVEPRIFSEVMRDIDLVVSVAHVGEVDPEASQSSIELRAVLLAETARLFKLDNIEIKGKHALIEGTMAKYSVHLGSAVAHQVAGSYLSILPVHSQHRGRLFLPFMDDDPKTAELMAKVLLLAKDEEIQDPTVLSQIKMK